MSSAQRCILAESTPKPKPLIKIENKKGPKMDPWETPFLLDGKGNYS